MKPRQSFQEAVKAVIRDLKRGEVLTYGEVARRAGYPRAARAVGNILATNLGLPWWRVVVTYALRNAILPVITIAGIVFSTMLGANVLVEKVFSWPGVASYALDALLSSDYAPVQGFVLLMATVFVIVNLLVDILYGIADPRVTIG